MELLRRIPLDHSGLADGNELYTPCCYSEKELPQLPPELKASFSLGLTIEWEEEKPEEMRYIALG